MCTRDALGRVHDDQEDFDDTNSASLLAFRCRPVSSPRVPYLRQVSQDHPSRTTCGWTAEFAGDNSVVKPRFQPGAGVRGRTPPDTPQH